jgi:Tfp pilus assembly protein FimV
MMVGTVQDIGRDELIESLKDQVEHLRRMIEARDMELQRKDSIIAALTQRIPALSAPAEPRETPETAAQDTIGSTIGTSGPHEEPAQRRSWLYRFFFGP